VTQTEGISVRVITMLPEPVTRAENLSVRVMRTLPQPVGFDSYRSLICKSNDSYRRLICQGDRSYRRLMCKSKKKDASASDSYRRHICESNLDAEVSQLGPDQTGVDWLLISASRSGTWLAPELSPCNSSRKLFLRSDEVRDVNVFLRSS
jgi:hypothetical protein